MVVPLRGWASFDHMGKSPAVASSTGFPVVMLGMAEMAGDQSSCQGFCMGGFIYPLFSWEAGGSIIPFHRREH